MSIFGKIKNVLFTEEETEEIPVIKPSTPVYEPKSVEEEPNRFKNVSYEEEVKPVIPIEKIKEPVVERVEERVEEKKEEKSPFQSFDEEEFERLAAINKSRLLERDRKAREEKQRGSVIHEEMKREERIPVKEEHKFKPTPVISPVYGILDKNYTKDDILPRASSEGTLPKIMDVDEVRQRAFGTLESIEKNIAEERFDTIKITSFDDNEDDYSINNSEKKKNVNIEDEIERPLEDIIEDADTKPLPTIDSIKNDEVKLEPEIDDLISIENDNSSKLVEDTIDEVNEENNKIENDLFDLIDSMYQEDGDN